MKAELSSLIDGELDEADQHKLFTVLREGDDLRAACREYHLIGDAIRRTPHLDIDLTARVMSELAHEPTVLAPSIPKRSTTESIPNPWTQGLLRIAAAVSGVAVVGWLALNAPSAPNEKSTLASVPPTTTTSLAAASQAASPPPTATASVSSEQAESMQPYLMAHQTYSPGSRFDGGAGYVRTVASVR